MQRRRGCFGTKDSHADIRGRITKELVNLYNTQKRDFLFLKKREDKEEPKESQDDGQDDYSFNQQLQHDDSLNAHHH